MTVADWTRRPHRFFQHLLREVDAIGLEPAALVAEAAAAGADGYLAMGGGFSAWYPTVLPSQARNPHLQGDVLGGLVEAAKRAGMRVLARIDVSKGPAAAAAAHPDWFVRRPDGSLSTVWEMPQICATGPYWGEETPAILAEILGRYPVDGFFFNYLHVPRCWCDRCRGLVRAATGEDVPPPGERRPAHERWRRDTLSAAVRGLRAGIAGRRPDAVLVPYHHVRDGWDYRAMAEIAGIVSAQISNPVVPNPVDPQPMWNHWAAEEALLARAAKPAAAPLLVQTASGFFASRQTAMPAGRMLRNLVQAAAHGAGTCPAVNGRLEGDDPRAAAPIRAFGAYAAAAAEWYRDLRSVARIALLRSDESLQWGPDAGRPAGDPARPGHLAEFRGLYEMLVALRHPCDVLPAGGLTAAELGRYAMVVLPAVSCLADADAAALDAFVAAGGALLATADTGAGDATGAARGSPALGCLPALPGLPRGVSGAYLAVDGAMRTALPGLPHVGVDGDFWEPDPHGAARTGLRLIGPFANNAPEFTVVQGPGTAPGLLQWRHGRGSATWLPWRPGALYHRLGIPDHRAIVAQIAADAAGPPPICSDAPEAVEFVLYDHPRGQVLHAINNAAVQGRPLLDVVPLAGFTVRVRGAAVVAWRLDTGCPVALQRDGAAAVLRLERLDGFAAFALLPAPAAVAPLPGPDAASTDRL